MLSENTYKTTEKSHKNISFQNKFSTFELNNVVSWSLKFRKVRISLSGKKNVRKFGTDVNAMSPVHPEAAGDKYFDSKNMEED